MIHNKIPDYKLVIYGSGPLESQINNYISAHKLSGKVFIIKGKTNITEQIKGASLFVLPSNTEGMPNALIEAMSMGLLCISTDCPIFGPRFLVQSGNNAFLTPINNPSELANNILLALNAPNADNIRHEAVKIRETLNSGVIFSKWITYIEKIFKS
jgi:glycosyltransferase involved in cell wall biosynthesis